MITVLIADDQELIRSALRGLITHEPDLVLVGEAANGADAVALARQHRPSVVLMDIRMPETDGIAATGLICGDPELAEVRVLILTTFEQDDYIVQALQAGASGFIGKGAESADLLKAIRTIHRGDSLLSPVATRSLIDRFIHHRAAPVASPGTLGSLTERETQVLALVGRGLSNQEISGRLVISPTTTKTHVNRIMTKLDAHDRAQLVIHAYENGLVGRSDDR
jgi:DNA-binding NarL/FixJ family response regulator